MNLDFLSDDMFNNSKTLIMLVGPPGSGKSTIARYIRSKFMNFEIVCPDDIREEITGDASNQDHNNEVFGIVYRRLKMYLDEGYNVIYDATNCRKAYRNKILTVVEGKYDKVICICLNTSITECLKRNAERDRKVPDEVIEKMYLTLHHHAPTIFEGYDVIIKA